MTTGIYSLYWEEQDLIYIGLSQNIEGRFTKHLRDLRNQKHTNYKVQNAFNSYGVPMLFILERCLIEELNAKEIQWMAEFDALGKQGLCIVEGGLAGFGVHSSGAKYSRRTILKVFSLLYRTKLGSTEIALRLKLPNTSLVYHIFSKTTHAWLKEEYPQQYSKMLFNNKSRGRVHKEYNMHSKVLLDPLNAPYTHINSIRSFCRNHILLKDNWVNSTNGISKVINGSIKSYKGWKLM